MRACGSAPVGRRLAATVDQVLFITLLLSPTTQHAPIDLEHGAARLQGTRRTGFIDQVYGHLTICRHDQSFPSSPQIAWAFLGGYQQGAASSQC